MRERLTTGIAILLSIVTAFVFVHTYEYSETLSIQLEAKERLIQKLLETDSVFSAKNSQYTSELSQYIKGGSGITIDGEELSTSELVSLLSKTLHENDSLRQHLEYHHMQQDSINIRNKAISETMDKYKKAVNTSHEEYEKLLSAYRDSTQVFKGIVRLAKRDYGINYKVDRSKPGYITFERETTKADSANWLYPFYKDKIIKDSKTGEIKIVVESHTKPAKPIKPK